MDDNLLKCTCVSAMRPNTGAISPRCPVHEPVFEIKSGINYRIDPNVFEDSWTEKHAQDILLGLDKRELLERAFTEVLKAYVESKSEEWNIDFVCYSRLDRGIPTRTHRRLNSAPEDNRY